MRLQSVTHNEMQGGARHTTSYFHTHCVDAVLPPARSFTGFPELEPSEKQELETAVVQNNAELQGNKKPRRDIPVMPPLLPLSQPSTSPRAMAAVAGGAGPVSSPVQEGLQVLTPPAAAVGQLNGHPHSESSLVSDETRSGGEPRDEGSGTDSEMPGLTSASWDDTEEDEEAEDSDDDLLDEGDDEAAFGGNAAMDLSWWKNVPLDSILALECVTAGFVPEGVEHAVATLKGQLGAHIRERKRANDTEGETQGWKALLAVDALLFFDLRGSESIPRKALVADRIRLCERGFWGTLWAHAEMESGPKSQDDEDELQKTAGRVNKLMEAKEVSKAATAVWGTGARVPAADVEAKLQST